MDNKRAVLKPSHIALRERRRKRRRFLIVFMLLIFLIAGITFASHLRSINVSIITTEGNKITSTRDITKLIEKEISGNYLFLISKANTFIFPKNYIEKKLLVEFPRIEKLWISRIGFNGLQVHIVERSGQYLWCGELIDQNTLPTDSSCYFIDKDGYIFGTAPYFSGDAYFKFYGSEDLDLTKSVIGQSLTTSERYTDFIRMIDGLEKLGIYSQAIKIRSNGEYRVVLTKVDNTHAVNSEIYYSREADVEVVLSNIETAMTSVEFKKQFDENRASLLYIDLRFKDKVYYKFKPQTATF